MLVIDKIFADVTYVVLYYTGYCDSEPDYCGTYKIFRLCENSPMGVKECCKSCPLQAAPITLPITLREDDIMLSIERQPMILPTGEIEVCCTAQSISNSERNATLSRPLACLVEAECEQLILFFLPPNYYDSILFAYNDNYLLH